MCLFALFQRSLDFAECVIYFINCFSQVPVVQSPVQTSQAGEKLVQAPPVSSKALRFPNRPGYGTIGRRCTVRANHFMVEVADRDLHHYDVRFLALFFLTHFTYTYILFMLLIMLLIAMFVYYTKNCGLVPPMELADDLLADLEGISFPRGY